MNYCKTGLAPVEGRYPDIERTRVGVGLKAVRDGYSVSVCCDFQRFVTVGKNTAGSGVGDLKLDQRIRGGLAVAGQNLNAQGLSRAFGRIS